MKKDYVCPIVCVTEISDNDCITTSVGGSFRSDWDEGFGGNG